VNLMKGRYPSISVLLRKAYFAEEKIRN